jgi:hypothetical protein
LPRAELVVEAYAWHWAGQRWYVSNVHVNPCGENWLFWEHHWFEDVGNVSWTLFCGNARRGRQYAIAITWTSARTHEHHFSQFYRTVYAPIQTERFYAPL